MEDRHRLSIQNNFSSLVEQTDLDDMVSILYEKGVFSEQMIEPYRDTNKDVRSRKRQLYMDITRRGPHAFQHLLDALSDNGYWDLVRSLDPNSSLHSWRQRSPTSVKSNKSNFISLRGEKQKTKTGAEAVKSTIITTPPVPSSVVEDLPAVPHFNVVKSTKFYEEDGKDKLYRTRGRNRGFVYMFSYVNFKHGVEKYRSGALVDIAKLKYLFNEMGLQVLQYQDLTKQETIDTLDSAKKVVNNVECLFVVVSSHGYEGMDGHTSDICCSDGGRINDNDIIAYFNNYNLPALRGIPKVFIFQFCRGFRGSDYDMDGRPAAEWAGWAGARAGAARGLRLQLQQDSADRLYSDIIVAYSTVPGYVSHRDPEKGSWYIQALCEVFAERAHDCHVDKLFALVDERMEHMFHKQTSCIEKLGFNSLLYLHPGLYEDADKPS